MKVRDLMKEIVHTVAPGTPVSETLNRMRSLGISVVAIGEGGHTLGAVSDLDVTTGGVNLPRVDSDAPVGAIESRTQPICQEEEDALDVAQRMQDQRLTQVLVVDADQKAVGMLTLGDLSEAESAGGAGRETPSQEPPQPPRDAAEEEARIDEAVEASFPASDPPSHGRTTGPANIQADGTGPQPISS